jgi:hypothetical protein
MNPSDRRRKSKNRGWTDTVLNARSASVLQFLVRSTDYLKQEARRASHARLSVSGTPLACRESIERIVGHCHEPGSIDGVHDADLWVRDRPIPRSRDRPGNYLHRGEKHGVCLLGPCPESARERRPRCTRVYSSRGGSRVIFAVLSGEGAVHQALNCREASLRWQSRCALPVRPRVPRVGRPRVPTFDLHPCGMSSVLGSQRFASTTATV